MHLEAKILQYWSIRQFNAQAPSKRQKRKLTEALGVNESTNKARENQSHFTFWLTHNTRAYDRNKVSTLHEKQSKNTYKWHWLLSKGRQHIYVYIHKQVQPLDARWIIIFRRDTKDVYKCDCVTKPVFIHIHINIPTHDVIRSNILPLTKGKRGTQQLRIGTYTRTYMCRCYETCLKGIHAETPLRRFLHKIAIKVLILLTHMSVTCS